MRVCKRTHGVPTAVPRPLTRAAVFCGAQWHDVGSIPVRIFSGLGAFSLCAPLAARMNAERSQCKRSSAKPNLDRAKGSLLHCVICCRSPFTIQMKVDQFH